MGRGKRKVVGGSSLGPLEGVGMWGQSPKGADGGSSEGCEKRWRLSDGKRRRDGGWSYIERVFEGDSRDGVAAAFAWTQG